MECRHEPEDHPALHYDFAVDRHRDDSHITIARCIVALPRDARVFGRPLSRGALPKSPAQPVWVGKLTESLLLIGLCRRYDGGCSLPSDSTFETGFIS